MNHARHNPQEQAASGFGLRQNRRSAAGPTWDTPQGELVEKCAFVVPSCSLCSP